MKKLLLLALLSFVFTACDSGLGNEENGGTPSTPKIELSQQSVEVEFESAEYEVTITSPYSWEATAKNDWIEVITETGIAGTKTLKFSVARNEEKEIREGTIVVKNEDYNIIAELYITQKAFVPAITIEPESLAFTSEGGTQEIAITANFEEYEASANADWLTIEKSEKGMLVTVTNYVEVDERTAEITISSEKYGISKTIAVTQKGVSAESQNVIIYTSSDGKIVTPSGSWGFGANIVSNTYRDGQGLIIFDAPVTSIGDNAFFNCTSLTSVNIPNSVTSIGDDAFFNCTSLTSVTIGNSVTSIGACAFGGCTSLKAFYGKFASSDNRCLIVDDVLYLFAIGCGATEYTIPESVTSIGDWAFCNCTSLTSVNIPNSVTSIGEVAFGGCTSLKAFYGKFASSDNRCLIVDDVLYLFAIGCGATEYTIPDSVTSIGDYAFYECTSLTSVTIPDSVTSIGIEAFCNCTSLTSVTIGNGVTSIGKWAFSGCTSLVSVYCKAITPPSGGSYMFSYYNSGYKPIGCTIYVPTESVDAYKSASGWSDYASSIVGYDF